MHDALYANGGRFAEADLVALADRLGLDVERFRAELIDGAHAARVARDADAARAAGDHRRRRRSSSTARATPDAFDAGSLVEALTSDPATRPTNLAPPCLAFVAPARRCASPCSSPPAAAATRPRRRRRTRSRTCPTRPASATSVKAAVDAGRGRLPGQQGQDARRSSPTGWPRARRWRWPARSSPRPATEPDGVRHDRARTGRRSTGRPRSTSRRRRATPAEGPFVAPADVLLTDARYRSKQAATTEDPFVAVYGADVEFPKRGQYAVLATTKQPDGTLTGATGQVAGLHRGRGPDPARRRQGAEGPHGHAGDRQGRRREDRHARAAERHARGRLRRRRGQEAGRAAVLDAAAVPVARVRPGDRHRAADEVQVRRPDGPSSTRRSTSTTTSTRACASRCGSSTCRPSRGCSSSTRTGMITARLEGSIGVQQFEDAVKSGL